jgi:hypothetical protein
MLYPSRDPRHDAFTRPGLGMVTLAAQATTQGQKPPLPRGTHRATVKVSGRRLLRYLRTAEGAGPRRPHRCARPRRAANLSIAFGTALSAIADDRVLLGTVAVAFAAGDAYLACQRNLRHRGEPPNDPAAEDRPEKGSGERCRLRLIEAQQTRRGRNVPRLARPPQAYLPMHDYGSGKIFVLEDLLELGVRVSA